MRRNNQGRGRSGRGRGCGRYQSTNNKSPEIKFYPHGSAKKGQTTTYATVKDHIISYVQRTYRHGQDIAISLRELKKRDLTSEEPTRKISSKTDDSKKLEQDGFDMKYQAEIKPIPRPAKWARRKSNEGICTDIWNLLQQSNTKSGGRASRF